MSKAWFRKEGQKWRWMMQRTSLRQDRVFDGAFTIFTLQIIVKMLFYVSYYSESVLYISILYKTSMDPILLYFEREHQISNYIRKEYNFYNKVSLKRKKLGWRKHGTCMIWIIERVIKVWTYIQSRSILKLKGALPSQC